MTTHTDFAAPVDRTSHEVPLPIGFAAAPPPIPAPVDTTVAPPSLAPYPRQVVVVPADGPIPGTVPATTYDPWRPLQHFPGPAPVNPPRVVASEGRGTLDADLIAAQSATVAASRAKLDRARSYTGRLGAHAAEIRAKLTAASERAALVAIGRAEPDPVDVGPLRGELVTVERQHRQALAISAEVEAEHARHEADLVALTGSDGAARAKLAEAHAARARAHDISADAKAILDRATAHAEAVEGRLAAARAAEASHDAEATARLRASLADGDTPPAAAEPLSRVSGALEDDLRAARSAVEVLAAERATKAEAAKAAHRAVLVAVDGVLVADAEQIARELAAADERALALRVRLHCYTKRTAGDWMPPDPKPGRLAAGGLYEPDPDYARAMALGPRLVVQSAVIGRAMASAPPPASTGPFAANWTAEHAAWNAYASALAADPAAESAFSDRPAVPPAPPLPVRAA